MCGRVDLSIPATNTPMTLRRRADRILRGEILGQELGRRRLGGLTVAMSCLESRVGDRARTLQNGERKGDGEMERRAGGEGGRNEWG